MIPKKTKKRINTLKARLRRCLNASRTICRFYCALILFGVLYIGFEAAMAFARLGIWAKYVLLLLVVDIVRSEFIGTPVSRFFVAIERHHRTFIKKRRFRPIIFFVTHTPHEAFLSLHVDVNQAIARVLAVTKPDSEVVLTTHLASNKILAQYNLPTRIENIKGIYRFVESFEAYITALFVSIIRGILLGKLYPIPDIWKHEWCSFFITKTKNLCG